MKLFPEQWVLVVDPQTDAALEVQAGRIAWHGTVRDEGYRVIAELKPRRFAVLFTGNDPQGMEYML
ncbi:MAG: hypothetical protein WD872_16595 [Pirellulaceae bacterium]